MAAGDLKAAAGDGRGGGERVEVRRVGVGVQAECGEQRHVD